MRTRIQGVFPPIATIFDASGRVDRRATADNVRQLMTTGLAGILALGSNGEAALLDEDENDAVVEAVREAVPRDRLLLVGVGRESTRHTVAAAKRAAKFGADAVLVRTPFFFKSQMTPAALYAHFQAVADSSPVPVLLYNLPGATGVTLTLPVVARLADHANIVGMKETSPDLERLGQFAAVRPDRFRVLSGWAPVVYPALAVGAAGAVLAVANVLPGECVALYDHFRGGRHADALAIQQRITTLAQLVTTIHGVAGLKVALELAGFHGGSVRAPLLAASTQARDEIAAAFAPWSAGAASRRAAGATRP
ncbi:MAG TPA: dihydrodipicolinate synthase family protein [Vicinamibacterales bacterium]|nr:dihydrodipicolinate synthase family protein [Vicinamibacterales bacterium]